MNFSRCQIWAELLHSHHLSPRYAHRFYDAALMLSGRVDGLIDFARPAGDDFLAETIRRALFYAASAARRHAASPQLLYFATRRYLLTPSLSLPLSASPHLSRHFGFRYASPYQLDSLFSLWLLLIFRARKTPAHLTESPRALRGYYSCYHIQPTLLFHVEKPMMSRRSGRCRRNLIDGERASYHADTFSSLSGSH